MTANEDFATGSGGGNYGNTVINFDVGGDSTAGTYGIYLEGCENIQTYGCHIEGVTTGIRLDSLIGTSNKVPTACWFYNTRWGTMTNAIDINDDGASAYGAEDCVFMGGYNPGGGGVNVAAGCRLNKFMFIRNFPEPGDADFTDNGTKTLVMLHDDGALGSGAFLVSPSITFPNTKGIIMRDNAGNPTTVMRTNASNVLYLTPIDGDDITVANILEDTTVVSYENDTVFYENEIVRS